MSDNLHESHVESSLDAAADSSSLTYGRVLPVHKEINLFCINSDLDLSNPYTSQDGFAERNEGMIRNE